MAEEPRPITGELTFVYERAPDYREVSIDGGMGGVVPTGDKVFVSLYSERAGTARAITHRVSNGALAEEVRREDDGNVVRFCHFGIYLDLSTARGVAAWLNERADELESARAARRAATEGTAVDG